MFVLAVLSIIQLAIPNLIPPGLTLVLIGVVFLVLFFTRWIHDALTLDMGWLLTGFGLSFWLSGMPQFAANALPLILIGLGFSFVAIYVTGISGDLLQAQAKTWPLVPALMLLVVAGILFFEEAFGRQKFWSIVIPLIPAISALWYLLDWRRQMEAASS
jgi:hypothetical protein